jgi:hypothetical protein
MRENKLVLLENQRGIRKSLLPCTSEGAVNDNYNHAEEVAYCR